MTPASSAHWRARTVFFYTAALIAVVLFLKNGSYWTLSRVGPLSANVGGTKESQPILFVTSVGVADHANQPTSKSDEGKTEGADVTSAPPRRTTPSVPKAVLSSESRHTDHDGGLTVEEALADIGRVVPLTDDERDLLRQALLVSPDHSVKDLGTLLDDDRAQAYDADVKQRRSLLLDQMASGFLDKIDGLLNLRTDQRGEVEAAMRGYFETSYAAEDNGVVETEGFVGGDDPNRRTSRREAIVLSKQIQSERVSALVGDLHGILDPWQARKLANILNRVGNR